MTTERELIRELRDIVAGFNNAMTGPFFAEQIAKADAYLATPEVQGVGHAVLGAIGARLKAGHIDPFERAHITAAEFSELSAAIRTPCPHIATSREGTSYCRLAESDARADGMRKALESIETYGMDTLSGPDRGVADLNWYVEGVEEMTELATAALTQPEKSP